MKKRIALLIDAENTNCNEIDFIIEKAMPYGDLMIRRVYGDFTKSNLSCWQEMIQKHALSVAQKFGYRKGKNSTDIELIMDAIELKILNKVDGIILVAGDSDYTGLALKCREANMQFIGIGKRESSEVLKRSCQEFIEFPEAEQANGQNSSMRFETAKLQGLTIVGHLKTDDRSSQIARCLKLIRSTIPLVLESDGYACLSRVVDLIRRKYFDFDIKKTGSSTVL